MAALDLAFVLEALTRLDLELVRLQNQADRLSAPWAGGTAMVALYVVLRRVSSAMRELRESVLDSTTPSKTVDLREAALQARIVVTSLQLSELQAAESTVPREFWHSTRHFDGVLDVAIVLNRELGRVNAEYVAQKKRLTARDPSESYDPALALVERAERAVDAIGQEPSLACFLAAGASVSAERFRSACRTIAILLSVPLAPQRRVFFVDDAKHRSLTDSPEGECDV